MANIFSIFMVGLTPARRQDPRFCRVFIVCSCCVRVVCTSQPAWLCSIQVPGRELRKLETSTPPSDRKLGARTPSTAAHRTPPFPVFFFCIHSYPAGRWTSVSTRCLHARGWMTAGCGGCSPHASEREFKERGAML